MVKPSQEGELFLHGHDIFFFKILAPFHILQKLPKVSDHFVRKIHHESTTLSIVVQKNHMIQITSCVQALKNLIMPILLKNTFLLQFN